MRSSVWNGGYSIVSSINTICALSVHFKLPWLLFLLVPAYALMLWPYFRLSKQHRRTTSRVVSLVLHSVIILLCVFMICGMSFEHTTVSIKNDVIILVDASDSNKASKDDMNEFIQNVVEESEDGYRLGIITFANGQVYAAELNSNGEQAYKNYIACTDKPEGNASDIASALMFAREKLADPSSGRIIILSDGLETDGSALAAVKTLADEGTRVDTKFFSPKGYKNEVQINSVEVPQTMAVGTTESIMVTLESVTEGSVQITAHIALYDNDVLYRELDAQLSGGTDVIPIDYTLINPTFHKFKVVVTADSDTISENNEYYSYLNIQASHKLLLVEGSENAAKSIEDLMKGDYELERKSVTELPATYEELCRYSEVVFANVANADLPVGYGDILTQYVEVFGGGFYTVGGDRAYQENDMKDSKYQDLLPVEASTGRKSLGLLLVIDRSSSMKENNRLNLAKDAAKASVNMLEDEDYIGIITFDEDPEATITNNGLFSMSRKDTVLDRIDKIELGYGTHYTKALTKANDLFTGFNETDLKHIIFLSDGDPQRDNEADYLRIIETMAKSDITLSTIALGASVSTETAEKMATVGKGRFYAVTNETRLREAMVEETKAASSQYENEKQTTLEIKSFTSAAVSGITEGDLPKLRGYYGTKLKNDATLILSHNTDPIYAEWSLGRGRVGSFTCDLSGKWSADFLSSQSGQKFIEQSISSLLPKTVDQTYADIRAEIVNDNLSAELHVYTDAQEWETVTAQLISPDRTTSTITLEKQTGSLFAGVFDMHDSGIYEIRITKTNGTETTEISAYTAFSYSKEYSAFANETECFQFLQSVSENGNGTTLFSPENLFGKQNEVVRSTFNPQLTFLIICIVLFLLDIVVRKFKIKWPHEIIRERRAKIGGNEI